MKRVNVCSNCGGELTFITEFLKEKLVSSKWYLGGTEFKNKECELYQCMKCGRLDVKE